MFLGGVVGCAKPNTAKRLIGYDITLKRNMNRACGCTADKDSPWGSIAGHREGGTWSAYYSEEGQEGWLIGTDSSTSTGNRVKDLTAANIISNLTGFSTNGWYQASEGEHLELAKNTKLIISGGDREYFIGEPLNLDGIQMKAITNNEAYNFDLDTQKPNPQIIESGFLISGYDPAKAGIQTVTITYGTIIGKYDVNVMDPETLAPSSIAVSKLPTKTEYEIGEMVVADGIEVIAHFNDNASKVIPDEFLNFNYPSTESAGKKIVKVNYGELETEFEIVVNESAVDILLGDVTGDGEIDSTDYLRIKGHFLGTFTLEGDAFKAGDVTKDGTIDSTDYLRIKGHFLGTYNLYVNN
jgi:hypothetical protein